MSKIMARVRWGNKEDITLPDALCSAFKSGHEGDCYYAHVMPMDERHPAETIELPAPTLMGARIEAARAVKRLRRER